MENQMIFDDAAKRKIGIMNFIPLALTALCLLYYAYLLMPLTMGNPEPATVSHITHANYDALFAMGAVTFIAGAIVLIVNIVLIAKLKNMNANEKLIWILLLSAFVPLALVAFWFFVIRKEPESVGMFHNMA